MKWISAFAGSLIKPSGLAPAPRQRPKRRDTLEERYLFKLEWVNDHIKDWAGKDCDGTLWNSLLVAAGCSSVNLDLCEYSPGEIHRRPPPSCWLGHDNGAKASTSNDMILGYLWGCIATGDKDRAKRLLDYATQNNLKMGDPWYRPRVWLRPNQMSILGKFLDTSWKRIPITYFPVEQDYQRHLQALSIALVHELTGRFTSNMIERVTELVKHDPSDPLFQAVAGLWTGQFDHAVNCLLNYKKPSYVRGEDIYRTIHWLFTASLILRET